MPRCVTGRDALTSRKIHDASEMEPKTPDRASWVVNGMLCNMVAGWVKLQAGAGDERVGEQQLVGQLLFDKALRKNES